MSELIKPDIINIIFATVTAIVVAAIGITKYLKTNKNKTHKLHFQFKVAVNNLQSTIIKLDELLPHVDKSRTDVIAALSESKSSKMKIWKKEFKEDFKTFEKLLIENNDLTADFHGLSNRVLKAKLIEIRKSQAQADYLKEKYKGCIKQDKIIHKTINAENQQWITRRL